MNGFEYKYHTPNDIFNNVLLISDISPTDLGVFLVTIFLFFILVLYIIPSIHIILIHAVKSYESKKRKNFIKQIAIQKDIEDQIAEEINVS
jgi:hypothetical protein